MSDLRTTPSARLTARPWDTTHFGLEVVSLEPTADAPLDARDVATLLGDGDHHRLAIARVPVDRWHDVMTLQAAGFFVCDGLVRLRLELGGLTSPRRGAVLATKEDAPLLEAFARDAFRDIPSHWRADPHLAGHRVGELYTAWLLGTLDDPDTEVCTWRERRHIIAVGGWRRLDPTHAEALLFGTGRSHRRRGYFGECLSAVLARCHEAGMGSFDYGCHLGNRGLMAWLVSRGFRVVDAWLTLHHHRFATQQGGRHV